MVTGDYEVRVIRGKTYAWRTLRKKRFLVAIGDPDTVYWRANPLSETPDLYLQFAQLPMDEEAILQFADDYGDLGKLGVPQRIIESPHTVGWDKSWIRQEITAFQQAIHIWADISESLVPGKPPQSVTLPDPQWNAWAAPITQRMRRYVHPIVYPNPLRTVWEAHGSVPAAWIQLWSAVHQNTPMARCGMCSKLFEKKIKKRYVRKFCSEACKQRDWRQRQS